MKKTTFLKTLGIFFLVQAIGAAGYAGTPYTLERCKQLALNNSLKIKNGELSVDAAAETKKAAFTAFFPKISASGNYFKSSKDIFNLEIPFMPGMSISMFDRATVLAVNIMQPLFTGGRIINGNKLANLGKQVYEKKLILTKNEILLKTEEQYWLLVTMDEKIKTLDIYSAMLDDLFKQVSDAHKYGLITRNDVLKVSVKQSELELNKQRIKNGRHLAGMAFCQLLGIEYDPGMELTDSLQPTVEPQQYYVDNEQALKNRAEFELLQYGIRAEKLQTAIKRGEYLPEVGLGASVFYLNAMNNGGIYNTAVFCSVSIPISGWWEASHILKEKKIKEKIAKNTLKDTSELLLLQMQKAWYELTESYKEMALAKELVKQAEENLKVSQDGYRQGVVNITDLLEAQALLQQARVQDIDSRAGNRIKLLNYLQVTGRYETR
jgi:outer membrane protein TolC